MSAEFSGAWYATGKDAELIGELTGKAVERDADGTPYISINNSEDMSSVLKTLVSNGHKAGVIDENQTPQNTDIDNVIRHSISVNHNTPYLLKKEDGSFVDPETGETLGFDHRFMGRGEGAQAHGWGSYFSVQDLRKYANVDYEYGMQYKGKSLPYSDLMQIAQSFVNDYSGDIDAIREHIEDAIQRAEKEGRDFVRDGYFYHVSLDEARKAVEQLSHKEDFTMPPRHHYDVEIPDDNGKNYLLEDAKISTEQEEMIKQGLLNNWYYQNAMRQQWKNRPSAAENVPFEEWLEDAAGVQAAYGRADGGRLYKELSMTMGSAENASKLLNEIGIVGMRFNGRRDGEGYVIFDANDARITNHVRFSFTKNREDYRTRGKRAWHFQESTKWKE